LFVVMLLLGYSWHAQKCAKSSKACLELIYFKLWVVNGNLSPKLG
jgi:hypothetical protein